MKKILCVGDFLYNSQKVIQNEVLAMFKVFAPIIKNAVKENVTLSFEITNDNGDKFTREEFYRLGNESVVLTDWHTQYKIEKFNAKQLEYLKLFFNKDVIVLGFELYRPLCDLLTSFGCSVIDFAFNSYKLLDDTTFAIYANNKNVYEALMKYQVPQEQFYYYANYWKVFMQTNKMVEDKDLEDNCVLFIGQTLKDKAVHKDGVYLNVTHFEDKLKELHEHYSKIYYLPHPMLGKRRKMIYDWVKKSPYIELITNRSTYGLLASDKVSKVVGISTSVLYEAQYFNKQIEYFYRPLFNIDAPFEEYSYVSIHDDCWNPKFWAEILAPICEVNEHVKDINYFKGCSNKLRNVRNTYWGYAQLDPIKRIPNFQESIKNLYRQYIAPHF